MVILHILKTSNGADWAFRQAQWLKLFGCDVIAVLPSKNGRYFQLYADAHIPVVIQDLSLNLRRFWEIPKKIIELKKIVQDYKPDVIHCHFVTNILFVRMALFRNPIPRFFQVPGPLHLEHFLTRSIDILFSNRFDYWGAGCRKTEAILKKNKKISSRVFLTYYGGYGGDSITKYDQQSEILRKQFKIPKDSPIIGMISYFYRPKWYLFQSRGIKGHEDFIKAISILKDKVDLYGIIIGGPWGNSSHYMNRLIKYAKEKCGSRIIFTNHRNDLFKIYKEIDVAVHPSLSENIGGAAESLAAGVPTITTNIGGFPDVIIDGYSGYLVNKKRPYEIASAIEKYLSNPDKAHQMALRGQKKVEQLLDINNTGKQIISVYSFLIRGEQNASE